MRLTEPMTMATDYLLAVLGAGFALSLWRRARRAGLRPPGLWILAFGVACLAAAAGGSFHGFKIQLGALRPWLWDITVAAILASSLLFLAAGVRSVRRAPRGAASIRERGKQRLYVAVLVTLAGLAILRSRLGLHAHFNHNDIYHLVQAVGLYWLYLGARDLEAVPARAADEDRA